MNAAVKYSAAAILLGILVSLAGCGTAPSASMAPEQHSLSTSTPDPQEVLRALMTAQALLGTAPPQPTQTLPPTPTATPSPSPTSTPALAIEGPFRYGESVLGYPLLYFRIGNGPKARMLVGGIHGGYEINTVVLMNEFLDELEVSPQLIPPEVTLYVIPCANPDGAVGGTDRLNGRLNGNEVDLNRNWDYLWQSTSNHGPWPVSGGSAPFSEPESYTLRDLILEEEIEAVIIYHSAMAAVFQGVGTETSDTVELALLMVEQTGYRYAPTEVDYEPTTGNAIDWLTINGITTIEIELSTHEDIDWEQNWRALMAFLQWNLVD